MIFECDIVHVCCRSRLGAWIEMEMHRTKHKTLESLPFGGRGLKFLYFSALPHLIMKSPLLGRGLK